MILDFNRRDNYNFMEEEEGIGVVDVGGEEEAGIITLELLAAWGKENLQWWYLVRPPGQERCYLVVEEDVEVEVECHICLCHPLSLCLLSRLRRKKEGGNGLEVIPQEMIQITRDHQVDIEADATDLDRPELNDREILPAEVVNTLRHL